MSCVCQLSKGRVYIFLKTVPIFLSTPAATAAKLGAKLGGAGSGLWHMSLRYKLFMLSRAGGETEVKDGRHGNHDD